MPGGWLLDVNVPAQLVSMLAGFGVDAETAAERGWKELTNGTLLEAASNAGFTAILTRDRLFGESASKAFKRFPAIALVVVTLPQAPASDFLSAFSTAWSNLVIRPVPGTTISWP